MDISSFRQLVNKTAAIMAGWPTDLIAKYEFLGLPKTGNYTTLFISDELCGRMNEAFVPGDIKIAAQCREMIGELIYEEILYNKPLKPYCELLAKIKDVTQSKQTLGSDTEEEWRRAIEWAHISVSEMSLDAAEGLMRLYPEYYAAAYAITRLKRLGYPVERNGARIAVNHEVETRLVQKIESIVSELGGLFVASKITSILSAAYDERQQRYHLVYPTPRPSKPQQPLIPFGYILQLAVKYYQNKRSTTIHSQERFQFLLELTRDYATILEIQDYSHFPIFPYVPGRMIEALQKKALADSVYKIPQVRASDVPHILSGLISDELLDDPFEEGWTIRQAVFIIDIIVNKLASRGLSRIFSRDVRKNCPSIAGDAVNFILSDVLSHPKSGANLKFSKPTDAPNISLRVCLESVYQRASLLSSRIAEAA